MYCCRIGLETLCSRHYTTIITLVAFPVSGHGRRPIASGLQTLVLSLASGVGIISRALSNATGHRNIILVLSTATSFRRRNRREGVTVNNRIARQFLAEFLASRCLTFVNDGRQGVT
jgi:hypothetical protein